MVRCHLIRQHPAGEKHETCFLMYCIHAHRLTSLRYSSSGNSAEFAPKHFPHFTEDPPYIPYLIFPRLVSQLLLTSRIGLVHFSTFSCGRIIP